MVQSNAPAEIYQLHILLLQINPPIWRRLHVCSDRSIATLHELLQIAFDWSDFHLHRFVIRGKEYGLSRIGSSAFRTDSKKALLSQFHFRVNERFLYEYDFGDLWQHQIRFEGIELVREKKLYPVCVGGACASPPEDCGGPEAYMEKMDDNRWNPPMDRGTLRQETLGLTLAEARSILAGIEQTVVEQQAAEFMAQQRTCSHCGHERCCKGRHHIVFRTPFGKLRLESPRLYHCQCESDERTSFSPLAELLQERSSPQLLYLETKFAALVSYGLTVELLQEVLPIRR